jgi:hypothetical protein
MASSATFLATAAEEPGSKDPPTEQDPAQGTSKQDSIPASSSAATETKGLGSNDEPGNREPAEGRQKPAENHRSKDLWNEAYSRLREEDSKLMDAYEKDLLAFGSPESPKAGAKASFDSPGGETCEEQLEKLVKYKLDAIQKTQLKITVGGEDIVVKDQVCKVVRTILSFKDFIGAAISAEPHAALAWAGVVIILPVSIGPHNQLLAGS